MRKPEPAAADRPAVFGSKAARFCQELLFFLGFFGYVWRVIEPPLQYQARGLAFFIDGHFFREHLDHPGGLVEFAAAGLVQCGQIGWLGALITTWIAWLISRIMWTWVVAAKGIALPVIYLFPAAVLLLLQSHYEAPAMELGLGLLLTASAIAVYRRAPFRSPWLRLAVFLALFLLLYYLAGGFALLFTIGSVVIECLSGQERWMAALTRLVVATAVPWLAARLWVIDPPEAYLHLVWPKAHPIVLAAYCFVILGLMVAAVVRPASEVKTDSTKRPSKTAAIDCEAVWWRSAVGQWASFLVFMGLTAGLVIPGLDPQQRALLHVAYYARQKMWSEVLRVAPQLKNIGPTEAGVAARMDINLALFHTGQLPYRLFSISQKRGLSLLPSIGVVTKWSRPMGDTLLALGQVCYAEHWGHEALEATGDLPDNLLRLARVNLVKGQAQAARTFLNRLHQNPFYRAAADHYLDQLDAKATWLNDPELARLRSLKPTTDIPSYYLEPEKLLMQLLQANPHNRMAFEYLMAHYLLTCQLGKVALNLGQLSNFDYQNTPELYQEALLLLPLAKPDQPISLENGRVSTQTAQRFREFHEQTRRYGDDREAAHKAVESEFGDSYWFYYLFSDVESSLPSTETKSYQ